VTTWSDGQVLTASALNGEFNNIVNDYDGSITNANISATAAIATSKIAFPVAESSVTFSGSGHGHTGGTDGKLITTTLYRAFAWYSPGGLITGTNIGPRYVVPQTMTIVKCWLIVRTAPTDAAITIDIHKNGTTIWSTQGNRATIAYGQTTGNTTTFNTTALSAGDYLDLDIDTVGSTVAGTDLTIVLECSQ
jgi:hypothetical protein